MFEAIIEQFQQATYDFRDTANPQDPLIHLFDEWLEYYRLKWAIAKVLKPTSILEIGVRFGYSAAAFLHGSPEATFVGIDLDTDTFGGTKGAVQWAEKITQPFRAEFVVADSQQMDRFPGGIYDLIHVDGQQDGSGSFHDLQLAIKQAHYVLVDGYFWTPQNYTAVSDFLYRYAGVLEFYGVIPGYAGELLIKVSDQYLAEVSQGIHDSARESTTIRQTYTSDYYTLDCGGYDSYKQYQGKQLADPRLQAVAAIAGIKTQGRFLDLGCGRGELAYHFAQKGFTVTAIDYSQAAIDLAENCFVGEPELRKNVEFQCDDVCTAPLKGHYDVAIASDVIEHLSVAEVDQLYQRVSEHLTPDGLFILHTYPNLWYYKYDYPRKRKIAASVGAYLSIEPRTRYEMLMHINEQSPQSLKRQLQQQFQYVLLWFGNPADPGGSLLSKFSIAQMRSAPSLFAIASHQPISPEQVGACLQDRSVSPTGSPAMNTALPAATTIESDPSSTLVSMDGMPDQSQVLHNGEGYPSTNTVSYLKAVLDNAESKSQTRTALPTRFDHFPFNISQPLQKFVLKLYSFLFKEQRAINFSLVEALRESLRMNQQFSKQLTALEMESRETSQNLAVLDSQLSSLNTSLKETADEERSLDTFYAVFEDNYRGSREEISRRLEVYLPLVEAANIGSDDSAILDVGCGRGEWLELLQEAGRKARGLDINRIMVGQCRSRGLEVAEGDLIEYLESLPDGSLGAVTGFHIIEHLPFPVLMKLFRETVRVLKPGGLAIFETPNPHNFFVSTHNFYLDPTHLKPLPASLMKFIAEQQGLTNVQIMELRPHPESAHIVEKYQAIGVELAEILGQHFYGSGDYGVIGYKP